jgi:hypothetical protein
MDRHDHHGSESTISRTFRSSLRHAGATLDAVNIAQVEQLPTRLRLIFHSDGGSD